MTEVSCAMGRVATLTQEARGLAVHDVLTGIAQVIEATQYASVVYVKFAEQLL